MAKVIYTQPNGKLALWSTIADAFTHLDMSEDEIIDYYIQESILPAIRRAREAIRLAEKMDYQFSPADWEGCLETMKIVHEGDDQIIKDVKHFGEKEK